MTSSNAAEADRFVATASRAPGTVASRGSAADPSNFERVVVEFVADGGTTVRADVAVYDNERYRVGQRVVVLYDRDEPSRRTQIEGDPYDAATPIGTAVAMMLLGVGLMARGPWWVRRVTRLAASDAPAFSMAARRWGGPDADWLSLYPLDAAPDSLPVASVRLMAGAAEGLPMQLTVLVRGTVADGSVIVARAGDRVLWPRGKARAGPRFERRKRGRLRSASGVWSPATLATSTRGVRVADRRTKAWLAVLQGAPVVLVAVGIGSIPLMVARAAEPWMVVTPVVTGIASLVAVAIRIRRMSVVIHARGVDVINLWRKEAFRWRDLTDITVVETSDGAPFPTGWPRFTGPRLHSRTGRSIFCWAAASTRPWIARGSLEPLRAAAEQHGLVVDESLWSEEEDEGVWW